MVLGHQAPQRRSVKIRRDNVYADAFAQLSDVPAMELKGEGSLHIEFESRVGGVEAGIDGGGLSREFMTQLVASSFSPAFGLWAQTDQNTLYPHPETAFVMTGDGSGGGGGGSIMAGGYTRHYEFMGKMLGKAIYDGVLVEAEFAPFFLKRLLGQAWTVDDMVSYVIGTLISCFSHPLPSSFVSNTIYQLVCGKSSQPSKNKNRKEISLSQSLSTCLPLVS